MDGPADRAAVLIGLWSVPLVTQVPTQNKQLMRRKLAESENQLCRVPSVRLARAS